MSDSLPPSSPVKHSRIRLEEGECIGCLHFNYEARIGWCLNFTGTGIQQHPVYEEPNHWGMATSWCISPRVKTICLLQGN